MPHQTQQSQGTSPSSLLPCGKGTPTATSDSQPPVQPDGSTTGQGIPTNKSSAQSQLTPQCVTHKHHPLNSNYLLEHKLICYLGIPFQLMRSQCLTLLKRKYQNHSIEKESRTAGNKLQHPQLIPKIVDSASNVNSWVT